MHIWLLLLLSSFSLGPILAAKGFLASAPLVLLLYAPCTLAQSPFSPLNNLLENLFRPNNNNKQHNNNNNLRNSFRGNFRQQRFIRHKTRPSETAPRRPETKIRPPALRPSPQQIDQVGSFDFQRPTFVKPVFSSSGHKPLFTNNAVHQAQAAIKAQPSFTRVQTTKLNKNPRGTKPVFSTPDFGSNGLNVIKNPVFNIKPQKPVFKASDTGSHSSVSSSQGFQGSQRFTEDDFTATSFFGDFPASNIRNEIPTSPIRNPQNNFFTNPPPPAVFNSPPAVFNSPPAVFNPPLAVTSRPTTVTSPPAAVTERPPPVTDFGKSESSGPNPDLTISGAGQYDTGSTRYYDELLAPQPGQHFPVAPYNPFYAPEVFTYSQEFIENDPYNQYFSSDNDIPGETQYYNQDSSNTGENQYYDGNNSNSGDNQYYNEDTSISEDNQYYNEDTSISEETQYRQGSESVQKNQENQDILKQPSGFETSFSQTTTEEQRLPSPTNGDVDNNQYAAVLSQAVNKPYQEDQPPSTHNQFNQDNVQNIFSSGQNNVVENGYQRIPTVEQKIQVAEKNYYPQQQQQQQEQQQQQQQQQQKLNSLPEEDNFFKDNARFTEHLPVASAPKSVQKVSISAKPFTPFQAEETTQKSFTITQNPRSFIAENNSDDLLIVPRGPIDAANTAPTRNESVHGIDDLIFLGYDESQETRDSKREQATGSALENIIEDRQFNGRRPRKGKSEDTYCGGASDLGFCALTETDIINDHSKLSNDVYDQSDLFGENFGQSQHEFQNFGQSQFQNSRIEGADRDIRVLLKQCQHVTDMFAGVFRPNEEDLGDNSEIAHAFKDGGSPWSWASYKYKKKQICHSQLSFILPAYAKDMQDTWYRVVQSPEILQKVAIDMCHDPGSPCPGVSDCGSKSRCVQRYNYQYLLSVEPALNDCPKIRAFKFPSGCVCHREV